MPKNRDSLVYAFLGIAFLILSLVFAFASIHIAVIPFGPVVLRYNPYETLLAVVFVAAGGFFMFRSGQSKPPSSVLRKSLVDQVKSVQDSQ